MASPFFSATYDPSFLELSRRGGVRMGGAAGDFVEVDLDLLSRHWSGGPDCLPSSGEGLYVIVRRPPCPGAVTEGSAIWCRSAGWSAVVSSTRPVGLRPSIEHSLSPMPVSPWGALARRAYRDPVPVPVCVPERLESWLSDPASLLLALEVMDG